MSMTAKEFAKLPKEEKDRRYKELSNQEAFIYRTQYDSVEGEVVGHVEFTAEEQKKNKEKADKYLRIIGVITDEKRNKN